MATEITTIEDLAADNRLRDLQVRQTNWANRTRESIRTSGIVNRLVRYALDEEDMDPGRVRVAQYLIDKVLPSLSAAAIEITDGRGKPSPRELTLDKLREEWQQIMTANVVPSQSLDHSRIDDE
jgi:hypothetical protein